jgi:hypothetical protein
MWITLIEVLYSNEEKHSPCLLNEEAEETGVDLT